MRAFLLTGLGLICCDKCKAKLVAAKPEKQLQMVFGSKTFSTAFKVTKD